MGLGITTSDAINAANELDRQSNEADTSAYLKGLQQNGSHWQPGGDYNGLAFHNAQLDFIQNRLQEENVKQLRFQNMKNRIDANQDEVKQYIQQGEGLLSLGDTKGFYDKYQQAYNSFIDGNKLEIDPSSNTIAVHNMDGTEDTTKFRSQADLVNHLRMMGENALDKTKFAQMAVPAYHQIIMHNSQRWQQMIPLKNKKGDKIMMATGLVSTKDGLPLADPGTGEHTGVMFMHGNNRLSMDQALKGGFITQAQAAQIANVQNKKADTRLKGAQADYYEAGAKAGGPGAKSSGKTMGNDEKLARLYMKAYGLNLQKATDMVRQDKAKSDKFRAYLQNMDVQTLDPSNQQDLEKLKQLRRQYGVDDYFPEDKQEKGLPNPSPKPTATPTKGSGWKAPNGKVYAEGTFIPVKGSKNKGYVVKGGKLVAATR